MNKIIEMLAKVIAFIVGLFKEQEEVEEVKGAERVQEVLGHFEEDVENLEIGIDEMSLKDRVLFERMETIKRERVALETSRNQGEKLLNGLKALLGD